MIAIARRAAAPVFTIAMFSSAALIFTLQPLVGRLVTPLLGGSPAVWNTSMAFFQGALLLGYVYAHVLARVSDLRVQAITHALVLAAAWVVLPIAVAPMFGPPSSEHPAFWLIGVLLVSVGAPFAAASATAPLLQAWYARTGRADAHDPYYLYAASNLGSFIGLLAYPVLIEPAIGLTAQTGLWSVGYLAVAALILVAATAAVIANAGAHADAAEEAASPTWRLRLYWLAAAALPSSLILGVTQHISTDVASAPFLWVAPLALYLLTFVIAFARGSERLSPYVMIAHPAALAIVVWLSYASRLDFMWSLGAHLLCFFVSALVCHLALARTRPAASRLTEFYFWVSLGGVVGGATTALLAPAIFNDIYEYPLALAAIALFRPRAEAPLLSLSNALAAATVTMAAIAFVLLFRTPVQTALFCAGLGGAAAMLGAALPSMGGGQPRAQRLAFLGAALVFAGLTTLALFKPDWVLTPASDNSGSVAGTAMLGYVVLAVALIVLAFVVQATLRAQRDDEGAHPLATDVALGVALPAITLLIALLAASRQFERDTIIALGLGIAGAALFMNRDRPRLLAALVLFSFAIVYLDDRYGGRVIDQRRSFFGVLRVEEFADDANPAAPILRVLMHGTTIHGAQLSGTPEFERHPLTYYNPNTALGEAIVAGLSGGETNRLALIGLGTGTTACLLRPTDELTIYEIDPLVVRMAASPQADFTYVNRCAPNARVVLGDARLRIAEAPEGAFDVIVVDAFSSDAIPAHLLTREAVAMYLSKTSERGIVVLHLSNRNLALVSEAVRVAASLNAPYLWRVSDRVTDAVAGPYTGLPASAMILARTPEALARVPLASTTWMALPTPPGRAWSDDYINLPRALWQSLNGVESCLQDQHRIDCGSEPAR